MDKVNKRVPHVAVVFEINGKVEEVIVVLLRPVDCLQQHLLSVLVGDVFNHYCRAAVQAIEYIIYVQ